MLHRDPTFRPSKQALVQAAPWMTLFFVAAVALEARAVSQPSVIQGVTISGTGRPLQLETKPGQFLERARVARDVRRLWATARYDDIRVLTESVREGVTVRFVLTERCQYLLRKVQVRPRRFDMDALSPGTFVERGELERLARTFEQRLKDSGYRDAIVKFKVIPIGIRQADVCFHVNEGSRTTIDRLEISGANGPELSPAVKILGPVRPRTLFPGIPGVWTGWKLRPELNQTVLDLTLQKLRSSYIARGYLDAVATVDSITLKENLASISIRLVPGSTYEVESVQISDNRLPASSAGIPTPLATPELPIEKLCRCLTEKRSQSERSGVVDFGTRLVIQRSDHDGNPHSGQGVSLAARIETGPAYTVRRIEFRGNHQLSDLTLRHALLLSEGEWFDRGRLRRSLVRLSLTGLIHPVTDSDVDIQRDSSQRALDLVISVREKDKGQWSLGAPVWTGLAGKSWLSVGSRLPNWGPTSLELPTYFIALNLTSPLFGLPFSILSPASLSVGLARPYLPGQGWRSGFQISPQMSWPQMLAASSVLQVKPRLQERLQQDSALYVPVEWSARSSNERSRLTAGLLVCETAGKPRNRMLSYVHSATEWLSVVGF